MRVYEYYIGDTHAGPMTNASFGELQRMVDWDRVELFDDGDSVTVSDLTEQARIILSLKRQGLL